MTITEPKWRAWQLPDIEQIHQLDRQASLFAWTLKNFQDCWQSEHTGKVICDVNGLIVGFIILQKVVDELHILNIAVRPSYQRQGIATQLLEQTLDFADNNNCYVISLEVRRSNEGAQRVYQRVGVNEISVRKDYYPAEKGREDAILMALDRSFSTF